MSAKLARGRPRSPRKVQVSLRLDQADVDRLDAVTRAFEARTPGMELTQSAAARAALRVGLEAVERGFGSVAANERAPKVLVGASIEPADLARLDAVAKRFEARSPGARRNRSAVARAAVRAGLDRIERELGIGARRRG
jgi:hypothetical protein